MSELVLVSEVDFADGTSGEFTFNKDDVNDIEWQAGDPMADDFWEDSFGDDNKARFECRVEDMIQLIEEVDGEEYREVSDWSYEIKNGEWEDFLFERNDNE